MDRANVVIVGGGVVGCALARELSSTISDVFLLEQMPKLGMATSSRNSGVIHSGLYYPPGSLKAQLCVLGNRLTREFCQTHGVPHKDCGKIVVAGHENEIAALESLAENGRTNGVPKIDLIGAERIHAIEPHVSAVAALEIPSTGIVLAEELTKAYARVAAEQGANLLTEARVSNLEGGADAIIVSVELGPAEDSERQSRERIETRCLINSAGLYADDIAGLLGATGHRIYPVRGEYAEVTHAKAGLINGLVYPLPHADHLSLGMHLTRTLWGTILVGPTARYIAAKDDYENDRLPLEEFVRGANLLLPELEPQDMHLAYSGIRPKLVPPDEHRIADFVIERDPQFPRAIHLLGIESPGLTAAPAIARHVAAMVKETLA